MATYDELIGVIKSIKSHTQLSVDGKVMVGKRLKSFLVSRLNQPETIAIEKPEVEKPKSKAKPEQLISESKKIE